MGIRTNKQVTQNVRLYLIKSAILEGTLNLGSKIRLVRSST